MTPFIIGNIQFTFSLVACTLLAMWYISPRLAKMEWQKAVVPLLVVHWFRYGPLTLLMPGQVSSEVPLDVAQTIAFGDLISSILAIIAAIMVWYNISGAKAMVWIFTIVGFGDVLLASAKGIGAGMIEMPIGFNLYILNFYVPMLIMTHIMIIRLLTKRWVTRVMVKILVIQN